jgi:hypothetical protein
MEDARYQVNNLEPSLDEVLAEPIVRQLMRRDNVTEMAVRRLMKRAAAGWPQPMLRLTTPLPDIGPKETPRASLGVLAQMAPPAWPRVFPSL